MEVHFLMITYASGAIRIKGAYGLMQFFSSVYGPKNAKIFRDRTLFTSFEREFYFSFSMVLDGGAFRGLRNCGS